MKVTTQNAHTERKRILVDGLKGCTFLVQKAQTVDVAASADHQQVCESVLGRADRQQSNESYIEWTDVSAIKIVDLMCALGRQ